MPEQAAQPAQNAGVGVWLNRLFLGFCIYVLIFGNPLKSMLPEVQTPGLSVANSTGSSVESTSQQLNITSTTGSHAPMLHPGHKLVRQRFCPFSEFCSPIAKIVW